MTSKKCPAGALHGLDRSYSTITADIYGELRRRYPHLGAARRPTPKLRGDPCPRQCGALVWGCAPSPPPPPPPPGGCVGAARATDACGGRVEHACEKVLR